MQQTIGFDDDGNRDKGFAKFAPELAVTPFYSDKKDLTGTVVVSTYQSYINLMTEGKINPDTFDLVICDEAQATLGEKTSENIKKLSPEAVKIGFTATDEYSEDKKVSDLFEKLIHFLDIKEAMRLGILSNARAYRYSTECEMEDAKLGSNGDYTQETLEKLNTAGRNKKAVEFVQELVSNGRRGLVSCLPGDKLAHAKEMSSLISDVQIKDPKTGETRNIRCQYVSGEMKTNERKRYYKLLDDGQLDCITFVNAVKEGIDIPNAKFLVSLRPTTSKVLSTQIRGRTFRKTGQDAVIVEFEDNFKDPDKKAYTIFDILKVRKIQQGEPLVETKFNSKDEKTEKEVKAPLSKEFMDKLQVEAVLERELCTDCQIEKKEPGIVKYKGKIYMSISKLSRFFDLKKEYLADLISAEGLEPFKIGKKEHYNSDEISSIFSQRKLTEDIKKEECSLGLISEYTGVPVKSLRDMLKYYNVEDSAAYNLGSIYNRIQKTLTTKGNIAEFIFSNDKLSEENMDLLLNSLDDPYALVNLIKKGGKEFSDIFDESKRDLFYEKIKAKQSGEFKVQDAGAVKSILGKLAKKSEESHAGIKDELKNIKITIFEPGLEKEISEIEAHCGQFKKIRNECARLRGELEGCRGRGASS